MKCKMILILALAAGVSRNLVFAEDGLTSPVKTTVVSAPTASEFLPMTRSERFRNYVLGLADFQSIVTAAASSGIRQAENSPKEWQGGAEGYGYRVGDAFAQHVIRHTLQYGASALLHEDNRYFVSGETGFAHRVKYAVASTFLARHDNGQREFSFSRVGSAAGTAFISRLWEPRSTTSAGDGAISFGIAMGSDIGFNVFREFWPDLKRHLRKR